MTYVYRFRSIDNLIHEHNELEEQELVLSSPRYFNDPLEGYQDVFWDGDETLWENLLRNYLLNLLRTNIQLPLLDYEEIKELGVRPDIVPEDLPTDSYKNIYESACETFFDERGFSELPAKLAAMPEPLKRNSLQMILRILHPTVLHIVLETLSDKGVISHDFESGDTIDAERLKDILDAISTEMASNSESEWMESLATIANPLSSHFSLQREVERGKEKLESATRKEMFVQDLFPQEYVREITTTLIHTDWHTVCFSTVCDSPPMWATYADDHKGAALMFDVDTETDERWGKFPIEEDGSESTVENPTRTLYEIDYDSSPPEVDFFRFLGQLPMPKLASAWLTNSDGEQGPRAQEISEEITEDDDAWMESLWNHFRTMSTRKLEQWEHEKEVRIVLPSIARSHGPTRKLYYDLSDLEGVVFGLRTNPQDRFEVMRILSEKGPEDGSPPVDFYEMVYDGTEFKKVRLNVSRES